MMGAGGLAIQEASEVSTNATATNATITTVPETRSRKNVIKPDVGLEWSNISIKFRVVGQDFHSSNDEYDLYPNVDPQAPSHRSLTLLKRTQRRSQIAESNTLSGYIGSSGGSSERSGDNHSVTSSGNNSEIGDGKSKKVPNSATNGSSNGAEKPIKHCPICKKSFSKAAYLKRHIQSHSSVKPYKCEICNWGK